MNLLLIPRSLLNPEQLEEVRRRDRESDRRTRLRQKGIVVPRPPYSGKIPRITKNCPVCGKTFETYIRTRGKNKGTVNQVCCGVACAAELGRRAYRENPKIRKKLKTNCPVCKKSFLTYFRYGKFMRKFCSRNCLVTERFERLEKRSDHFIKKRITKVLCLNCKKEIETGVAISTPIKEFCSLNCALQTGINPKQENMCKTCGKIFITYISWKRNKKYCSKACKPKPQNKNYYGRLWNKIRIEIRSRDNYTCQRCKLYRISPSLDVHHITPIKKFINADDGNIFENLITLCHDCHVYVEKHSLDFTPTFKVKVYDKKYLRA